MEEFKSPSEEVADCLKDFLDKAERGELISLHIVAVGVDGNYYNGGTSFNSRIQRGGALLDMAIKALGYQVNPDIEQGE